MEDVRTSARARAARGFLSGALTSSFEAAGAAAVAKCDYGAKNGIFAWPLAPSHFRPPFPQMDSSPFLFGRVGLLCSY